MDASHKFGSIFWRNIKKSNDDKGFVEAQGGILKIFLCEIK